MKDHSERIEALSDERRALLTRLVTRAVESCASSTRAEETDARPPGHVLREEYDIVVMGGGLAGSTVAIQLHRACPDAAILVVNSNRYPAPEAAHKVGESSVEIGAHYYDSVLGFREHLEDRQLRKMGLRFFSPYADNRDLARRNELGPFENHLLPIPSYQIDSGRFENMLALSAAKEGIAFLDECQVSELTLGRGETAHLIELTRRGQSHRTRARWVIDASGRAALIRRKLGLTKPSEHNVNAAWMRVKIPIDVEKFSDDPEFRGRMLNGFRQYSTTHLMGRSYWVWIIRLASGSTSVGIVADPRLHPLDTFNQVDRFIDWLDRNEPLMGELIPNESVADPGLPRHQETGLHQRAGLLHGPLGAGRRRGALHRSPLLARFGLHRDG